MKQQIAYSESCLNSNCFLPRSGYQFGVQKDFCMKNYCIYFSESAFPFLEVRVSEGRLYGVRAFCELCRLPATDNPIQSSPQKKCSGNARWLYFFAVRGCICLQPLCHKKALIVGVYFSALNFPFASEKIYPHLFRRAAGRVGCTFLFSAPTLRSGFFLRGAVSHPQEYAAPIPTLIPLLLATPPHAFWHAS